MCLPCFSTTNTRIKLANLSPHAPEKLVTALTIRGRLTDAWKLYTSPSYEENGFSSPVLLHGAGIDTTLTRRHLFWPRQLPWLREHLVMQWLLPVLPVSPQTRHGHPSPVVAGWWHGEFPLPRAGLHPVQAEGSPRGHPAHQTSTLGGVPQAGPFQPHHHGMGPAQPHTAPPVSLPPEPPGRSHRAGGEGSTAVPGCWFLSASPQGGNGAFWQLFRLQIEPGEEKLLLSQLIIQPSHLYQGIKLNGFLKREYI